MDSNRGKSHYSSPIIASFVRCHTDSTDILRESQNLLFSPTSPDKEFIYRPDTGCCSSPPELKMKDKGSQTVSFLQSSACVFWLLEPCTMKPPHCSVWETLTYLCRINGWNMFGHVLLNSRLSNEESEIRLTSLVLSFQIGWKESSFM